MRKKSLGAVVAAGAMLVGCHTITEELPTEPNRVEAPATGVLTVAIPALAVGAATPTPTATPTPAPASPAPPPPEPTPEPPAAPTPPPESAGDCGAPLPPQIQKMKAKIHIRGGSKWTLDSTALVAGSDYCRKIGFTDGRSRCPVRPEGHPEREACEAYAIGAAEDTGRFGPTWTRNEQYCDNSACENHPNNQHMLWAYKNGSYKACAQNGVCATVKVNR